MGVGTPKYGTIAHGKLNIGRAALPDGEKQRPNYLGKTVALGLSTIRKKNAETEIALTQGATDPSVSICTPSR